MKFDLNGETRGDYFVSHEMKKVWQVEMDLLDQLLKVCKEHNLRCWVDGGSLLGAVRHKGFIPWDDDIDIAMPRSDYEKLLAHAAEWLPGQYELISAENDANYPHPFAKIQNANTTLIEREHMNYLGGIYIDVFPLDGVPENRIARRWHFIKYKFYIKALYFTYRNPYRHGHGPSSWLPLLCRRLFTVEGLQHKLRAMMTSNDYDKSKFVVDHDDGLKGVMERSILGSPTPIQFENVTVMGVEHPHDYLHQKYGEYMVVPPHSKQIQHNFYYLDLDMPYKEYAKKNNR